MQKYKKIISLLTLIALFVPLLSTTVLSSSATDLSDNSGNSLLHSSFANRAPKLAEEIQSDTLMSDHKKIETLLKLFFEVKRDQYAHSSLDNFDFSCFWNPSSTKKNTLSYFERSVQAEKDTLEIFGQYAADSSTTLTIKDININSQSATVRVYEWIEYNLRSLDTGELCWPSTTGRKTGTGITYTIVFIKQNDSWLIESVDFYNEATEILKDERVSVASVVQDRFDTAGRISNSATSETRSTVSPKGAVLPPGLPVITNLSQTKFCSYAHQYAGSNRSPLFVDCSDLGGDCQNYASQCLWYGLGGTTTANAVSSALKPMISSSITSDTSRHWYHKSNGAHTGSWTGVNEFHSYVLGGNSNTVGLFGSVYSGVSKAQAGDIIQIRSAGASSYYHSYVVVSVSGEYGSRTTSNITICSHTADRTSTGLNFIVNSDNLLRTIHVDGVVTLTE